MLLSPFQAAHRPVLRTGPHPATATPSHPFQRPALRPQALQQRSAIKSRARQPVQAASGGGGGSSGGGAPSAVVQLVASPLYRVWLQLGVVLLLAMLVDAGYSGDWSRIEVLTKEQEAWLQQAAVAVGCFHLACGATAAAVSSRRGENWPPRVAKVLAVGFLALVEVVLLPEGLQQDQDGS